MSATLTPSRNLLPLPTGGRVGEGGSHLPSDNFQLTERP